MPQKYTEMPQKKANSYCLIKIRAITLIVWMQRRVEKNTKKGKKNL